MKTLLIFILVGLSFSVFGTRQRPDSVRIDNNIFLMHVSLYFNNPVLEYFLRNKKMSPFEPSSSNCSRGHIAVYSIENDSIYIDGVWNSGTTFVDQIDQRTKKHKVVYNKFSIDTLFNQNGKDGKIFTEWFTGYLRIETLAYEANRIDPCDGSTMITVDSDEYTILKVVKGRIVSKTTYDNLTFWALQWNCDSNKVTSVSEKSYNEYNKWSQKKSGKKKYWTKAKAANKM